MAIGLTACGASRTARVASPVPASDDASAGTITVAAALAPEAIYNRVAPAVAFVETPLGTGSGLLLADGLVLTNAHVVWPFESVRVAFAGGAEYEAVPVVAVDPLIDMAALDLGAAGGPPAGVDAVALGDGTSLAIGSELYLVGYPAETEAEPVPAMTRGILSRHRRWGARELGVDLPFLQTDADIAPGQSGGALVAGDGTVVGISSMFLGDSDLALAMGAPEAEAHVRQVLAGTAKDLAAPRPVPLGGGATAHAVALHGAWDEAVFTLNAGYGATVDVAAESLADVALSVIGSYGDVDLDLDDGTSGRESGTVEILDDGPYFVVVTLDRAGEVALTAGEPLAPLEDPDDGRTLRAGATSIGMLDFPGDVDAFRVALSAGRTLRIVVDTINFTPEVEVDGPARGGAGPSVDLWLGGPLGLTLDAALTATEGGEHVLRVWDADGVGTGGYLVRVE